VEKFRRGPVCDPTLAYQRIVGGLKGLGIVLPATSVRSWLRAAGLGPAGTRRGNVSASSFAIATRSSATRLTRCSEAQASRSF
jgi:hypothetical protein